MSHLHRSIVSVVFHAAVSASPGLLLPLLLSACLLPVMADEGPRQGRDFDRQVAPILASRCLSCHGADTPHGELRMDTRDNLLQGGESGPAAVPGQPDQSLLLQRVLQNEMPPKKPLSDQEKQILVQWIREGAVWGTSPIDPFRFSSEGSAGLDWWSLQQPLDHEPPPADSSDRNAIDQFVRAGLQKKSLSRSPEADRHTLIRRLYFDLLGLPPTHEEISRFVNDNSPDAWEQLVDRTLNSPHYGERWARHWLDVVRFGESNGFEYDEPRDNAWPYRNWVIDALNKDIPYDEFVRMQLAGDILAPESAQAAAASAFLVAGAHNTTLPSSEKMRMSMAQDEIEDLVAVVGQTFLGLTVNCARCHDHKFDPISQKEYYQLAASLADVRHGNRTLSVPLTPEQQQQLADAQATQKQAMEEQQQLLDPIRTAILAERKAGQQKELQPPTPMAAWEFDGDLRDAIGELHGSAQGAARVEQGCLVLDGQNSWVETVPLNRSLKEKTLEAWVQLDNADQSGGGVISLQTLDGSTFDAIVYAERERLRWMAGSNGFVRTAPFNGFDETEAQARFVHVAIVYAADGHITGYRNGMPYGNPYRPGDVQTFPELSTQIVFGMRHAPAGGNRMLKGRIERARLYDRALTPEEIATSAAAADSSIITPAQLLAAMNDNQKSRLQQLQQTISTKADLEKRILESQPLSLYTCISGDPGIVHVLHRGDVSQPRDVVSPSGLRAVTSVNPDFGLPANAPGGERRKALSAWITNPENHLFSRVMVNRIWHYHFGQGLVATPGDFGFNGGKPDFPELLDWLSVHFRKSGFRIKALHRLILTSATWKQSSALRSDAFEVDAENRLLWRKSPLRLEAEEIRDAMLAMTGLLDRTTGGKGYRDMRHFQFKGSNFYDPLVEGDEPVWRRTIYRFSPRGGRNPFLDTFDCPDPSAAAQKRATTTTPLQALALMNNDLVFRMSEALAQRAQQHSGTDLRSQISFLCETVYGRAASETDLQLADSFVRDHGLAAYCRVLLNSNEFLFVR